MQKKIAIPTNEGGVLEAHFGHAPFFSFIYVEGQEVVKTERVVAPEHKPGLLPQWMKEHQVTDVIAAGMGNKALVLFRDAQINVFTGAAAEKPEVLVARFLEHDLHFDGNACTQKPDHVCDHH